MSADEIRETLYGQRLVVVHREKSAEPVREKVRAAAEAGVKVQEVTWTTPSAPEIIAELSRAGLGAIGAGTILTLGEAKQAHDAGAQFFVSPVFTRPVYDFARAKGVVYIPGCATAQETYAAWTVECRPLKIFPAPTLGGPEFIRRLLAPMPFLELLPTLIAVDEIPAYLEAGARAVGIGAASAPDAAGVSAMCRRALELIK